MTVRPRRSVLYMPGSNARALEKGRDLPADGLILDLEDAVAPEAKVQARDAVVKAMQQGFGSVPDPDVKKYLAFPSIVRIFFEVTK